MTTVRPSPSTETLAFQDDLRPLWDYTVPANTGFGFTVPAGHFWRFNIVDQPQIIDMCITTVADPDEHLHVGTMLVFESGFVSRGTRLWGTPPESRVLATCTADTLRPREHPSGARDHVCHGAHCNPHHWVLYEGIHPRTCYDNLRAAMAMVGLDQTAIHDNLNLFQRTVIDPASGHYLEYRSSAEAGDYIEFLAHTDLHVAMSLCPQGAGPGPDDDHVPYHDITCFPIKVEVLMLPEEDPSR